VTKEVAGLPNLNSAYVWDGVDLFRSGLTSISSWETTVVMPKQTQPSTTTTQATFMAMQDVYADTNGRLFIIHSVDGAFYLTVMSGPGTIIYQNTLPIWQLIPSEAFAQPRLYEDAKGRLWLIVFGKNSSTGAGALSLFPINSNFSLGTRVDLGAALSGYPGADGFGYIASPRGGNLLSDSIYGVYPSGSDMIYFKVRLPN
jgi:hypothetical protein